MIEELTQGWDGSIWVNYWKKTYTYDENNNMIEMLSQTWDNSNWVNYLKGINTYDENNNMIEELSLVWVSSNWVNNTKWIYIYDVYNNRIEWLQQFWDGGNWLDVFKYTYIYDVNNNMVEELRQQWDGNNWVNGTKINFSYIITEIEQLAVGIKAYSLSNNYPNPFNPITTITYQIPELSFVTLKVYDVLGSELATLVNKEKPVGSYEVEFDATGLPSGIYFYKVQAGNYVETKKMVLLK